MYYIYILECLTVLINNTDLSRYDEVKLFELSSNTKIYYLQDCRSNYTTVDLRFSKDNNPEMIPLYHVMINCILDCRTKLVRKIESNHGEYTKQVGKNSLHISFRIPSSFLHSSLRDIQERIYRTFINKKVIKRQINLTKSQYENNPQEMINKSHFRSPTEYDQVHSSFRILFDRDYFEGSYDKFIAREKSRCCLKKGFDIKKRFEGFYEKYVFLINHMVKDKLRKADLSILIQTNLSIGGVKDRIDEFNFRRESTQVMEVNIPEQMSSSILTVIHGHKDWFNISISTRVPKYPDILDYFLYKVELCMWQIMPEENFLVDFDVEESLLNIRITEFTQFTSIFDSYILKEIIYNRKAYLKDLMRDIRSIEHCSHSNMIRSSLKLLIVFLLEIKKIDMEDFIEWKKSTEKKHEMIFSTVHPLSESIHLHNLIISYPELYSNGKSVDTLSDFEFLKDGFFDCKHFNFSMSRKVKQSEEKCEEEDFKATEMIFQSINERELEIKSQARLQSDSVQKPENLTIYSLDTCRPEFALVFSETSREELSLKLLEEFLDRIKDHFEKFSPSSGTKIIKNYTSSFLIFKIVGEKETFTKDLKYYLSILKVVGENSYSSRNYRNLPVEVFGKINTHFIYVGERTHKVTHLVIDLLENIHFTSKYEEASSDSYWNLPLPNVRKDYSISCLRLKIESFRTLEDLVYYRIYNILLYSELHSYFCCSNKLAYHTKLVLDRVAYRTTLCGLVIASKHNPKVIKVHFTNFIAGMKKQISKMTEEDFILLKKRSKYELQIKEYKSSGVIIEDIVNWQFLVEYDNLQQEIDKLLSCRINLETFRKRSIHWLTNSIKIEIGN